MKILLADDHPLFREGVKPVLENLDATAEILEAVDFPSVFETMRRAEDIDLVLMDLNMPGMDGIDGVHRFRATFPEAPLVILSASEEVDDIRCLLAAGALGYITKSTPSGDILAALRRVLAGGLYAPPQLLDCGEGIPPPFHRRHPTLSDRHVQVLRELIKGMSNKQIGDMLEVTEGTVKTHLAAIFRILKVSNRTEAVLIAQKMGLGDAD